MKLLRAAFSNLPMLLENGDLRLSDFWFRSENMVKDGFVGLVKNWWISYYRDLLIIAYKINAN